MKRAPKSLWILIALLCFAGILKATLPQVVIGTWTSAASLAQPRSNTSAVMLSDGRILIVGGDGASGPLQSAEFFATDGTVSPAAAMNVARSQHFAVVLSDGRVLVGGGTSGGGTTNSAEIYDPSNDSWTQTNPLTQARAGATAALLQDGRVLIAGGDNSGTPSNTIEIYDPSTGNFSFAGTLSSPRTKHAMAVLQDGQVLIVGGFDGTNPLASSDIFDPSSGNVSAGPNLATARYSHSATTLLNGQVVVIGGAGARSNGTTDLASAEVFDPLTGAFTTASAALTTAREAHQAYLLPKNNNLLIVGGTSSGATVAASELFTPQVSPTSGAWTYAIAPTGSNVTPRNAASGSAMQQDGLLLAAGGSDASGNALASTELYAFPVVKTDASDYAPGSIVTITGSGWQPGETVTLSFVESPLIDTHPNLTAVADGNGNIVNNQFSPDQHDVGVRFYLTAVGSQSGLQAQNTFTDASLTGDPIATFQSNCTTASSAFTAGNTVCAKAGPAVVGGGGAAPTLDIQWVNPSSTVVQDDAFAVNNGDTKTDSFSPTVAGNWTVRSCSNVTCNGGNRLSTAAFTVSAAAANKLTFATQPTGTQAGSAIPTFTVNVQDQFGNLVSSSASITLSITSGTGTAGAALGGTTTVNASGGIATFSNLSINKVGTGYTLTATSGVLTSAVSSAFNITTRAITVTAATNTKGYDGTTSAAVVPTITSGTLAPGDTANFIETYNNKNAGTGKTLTPSGTVNDGNGGNNYTYTFVTNTTGVITASAITVTAATNSKVYDGTTSAAATPTITSGAVATGDTANFTETYNNKNVGTGKTLTPAGTVTDGNSGNNYSYTFVTNTTGVITARAITVTAATNTKGYDGTTSAAATPTITTGTLATGDTANFSEAYASKNVGTNLTLTPSGTVTDGNSGNNYAVTFANNTAGVITARAITVTASTNSKPYDQTTSAAAIPTITSGSLITGDSASFSETYTTKNAGTGKTLTPAGAVADGNGGNNYAVTFVNNTTGVIIAKALTVTGVTANNKIYDGTTAATLNTVSASLVGVISGDSVSLNTGTATGTFASAGVGNGISVSVSGISLSGTDAGNYSLTPPTTTANITPKTLTVQGEVGVDKVYDATTTATVDFTNATLVGKISGDVVNLNSGSYTASFADKNVGNSKTVTIAGLKLVGMDAGNYQLGTLQATTTANITPKPLTITGVTANNKIYDGSANATLNTGSAVPSGVISGDSVTLNSAVAAGAFADKNVGNNKPVTVTGFTISGTDAGNYSLAQPAGLTANITPKSLTITGVTANNKVYDGGASATLGGTAVLNGVVSGDAVTLSSSGVSASFADKNVGNSKPVTVTGYTISGTDAGNYSVSQPTGLTADITPKALTITGVTANSEVYDGTTTATLSFASATLVGVISPDLVTINSTSATGAFADKNVGTAKAVTVTGVTLSGADAANYTVSQPTGVTANITAKNLTITGGTASNKVYDGNTTATLSFGGATLVGVISPDVVTINSTSATGAFADKNVGTAKSVTVTGIALGGADAGNYTVSQPIGVTADITAKNLTINGVTANNKVYDGNTTATLSFGGATLVGVISPDVVTTNSTNTTGMFADKNVGTAKAVTVTGVALSGADAGNYTVSQPTGVAADITAKNLTIAGVTASNKVYDGNTTATLGFGAASLVGVVNPDVVTINSAGATGAFADKNVGTAKAVTVTGVALGGADAGNYTASQPTGVTADITALHITGSFTASNKQYDGNASATVLMRSLNGAIGGDTVSLTGGTAMFADKSVGMNKTVTLTGASLNGSDAGNYVLDSVATTTADITALHITGSFTASNKQYDGNASATVLMRSLNGAISGDTVSLTGGTAMFADKNVGMNNTVTLTGASLNGSDAGNYVLDSVATTTADITAAPITVTAAMDTKQYDGTTSSSAVPTVTTGSLVGGDTGSFTQTFDTKNAGTGKTLTPSGTVSDGNGGNNYNVTFVAVSTGTISARPITVTAATNSKTYDSTTSAAATPTITAGSLASGDTASFTEVYSTKNVGTNLTLTPSGSVSDGNSGNNYAVTFVNNTTGVINKAPLTITAATNTKTYDATTTAAATPTVSGLQGSDTVTGLSESYTDPNAGAGKTLIVNAGYTINDGNSGNNYTVTTVNSTTGVINKADAIINVTPYSVTYDASPHTATGSAKGVLNESLSGLNLSGTTHTNPGSYLSDPWTFTDVTGNYNNTNGTVKDYILFATGRICNNGLASHVILQPINADGTSVFKAGSTVPTKFAVCDVNGNSVGPNTAFPNQSVVKSYIVAAASFGTVSGVDETTYSTTPDQYFRWDSTAQQWIFNQATGKSTNLTATNATYVFQITLIDGTIITQSVPTYNGMLGYQYGLK